MKPKKDLAFLAIILLIFLLLKSHGFQHSRTDENIYFYVGKLVAEGKVPYRDFFFAHPPLPLLPFALIFAAFGFNFILLKSVSVIAIIIAAYYLFRLVAEETDLKTGILSTIVFLFSYDVLRASAHPTGINLTVMLMVAGFYYFVRGRPLSSGIILGFGALTGLYAGILVFGLFIYLVMKKRTVKEFLLGFLAVFGIANLILILLAGENFINSVYLYHLMKPESGGHNLRVMQRIAEMNIPFLITLVLFPLIILRNRWNLPEYIQVALITTALYILFILSLKRIFDFYFMLLFPFLAILSGYIINALLKRNADLIIMLLLIIYSAWTIPLYLDHESHYFEKADDISAYVRENSNPDETIFGDSGSVPLIALLAGRRIALDEADTNYMRFRSGITNINETIERLRNSESFRFFIIKPKAGIAALREVQLYLRDSCRPVERFNDRYKGGFVVYDCSY